MLVEQSVNRTILQAAAFRQIWNLLFTVTFVQNLTRIVLHFTVTRTEIMV